MIMALKNFEDQIKDKLDKRELPPSDAAWIKLSAELETGSVTGKRTVYIVAAASVLIGLITFSMVFFNHVGQLDGIEVRVVESPKPDIGTKEIPEKTIFQELPKENEYKVVEQQKIKKEIRDNKDLHETDVKPVSLDEPQIELSSLKVLSLNQQEIINSKIEEVFSQVALMEKENSNVTDEEVDSLLNRARQELFREKIFKDNYSVDGMALLADVESELDKSFREQIFNLLKDGYFKVKTTVAARKN